MFGFGPPATRPARREWWRRQIQRQNEGNVTVTEFCRRLGVTTVTFYAWKRRLAQSPTAAPRPAENPSAPPQPDAQAGPTPAFLPVSIRDTRPDGQIEIELANACVVRLTGAVDPQLLRIAIHAAGRLGGHLRGTQ